MDKDLESKVRKYVQVNGPSVNTEVKSNAGRHTVTSVHPRGRHWTSVHDHEVEAKLVAHRLSKKAEAAHSAQQGVDHSMHRDEV